MLFYAGTRAGATREIISKLRWRMLYKRQLLTHLSVVFRFSRDMPLKIGLLIFACFVFNTFGREVPDQAYARFRVETKQKFIGEKPKAEHGVSCSQVLKVHLNTVCSDSLD